MQKVCVVLSIVCCYVVVVMVWGWMEVLCLVVVRVEIVGCVIVVFDNEGKIVKEGDVFCELVFDDCEVKCLEVEV